MELTSDQVTELLAGYRAAQRGDAFDWTQSPEWRDGFDFWHMQHD